MKVFLSILFYILALPSVAQPLRVDRGGMGIANVPLNNLLLGNGIAPLTLLAPGTNGYILTIVAGAPSWQPSSAGSGTVTSVGLSLPNIFTVTNSPVTTSGALTGTLASQNQNLVFASPNGSSGSPSFRALVSADIPSLSYEPVITAGTTGQYWRGDKSWQTLNASAVGLGNVTNNAQLKIASNLSDVANANTSLNNLLPSQSTHNGEFLTTNGTDASWAASAGSGTVTSVSVVTANGLSGTVANPTTAPAITLDISGLALTKLASIADQRILGNVSGGSAAAIALTNTQAKTFLAIANTDVSGLGTASTHPTGDFVLSNGAITGATKTKITYDAKGLVTSGADATTADIAASTDKNYVTDAQLVVIGNTSGTNSGDITIAGENYLSLSGQVLTANAVDLSGSNATGTLSASRFPALTGDVTNSAGSLSATVGAIQNKSITLATGYLKYNGSAFIFDNSTFITGNQTITLSGDITGSGATSITTTLSTLGQTALKLKGGDANAVTIKINETETGARIWNLKLNDADRTVDLSGNLTVPSDATVSGTNTGDQTITLTSDVTGTGTGSFATTIANSAVTLAKMANVATSTLFYRKTAGSGAPEVNTLATLKTDLLLTGTNSGDVTLAGENYLSLSSQVITANAVDLSGTNVTGTLAAARFGALTGDVTNSAGSYATTIANDAITTLKILNANVTLAKIANAAASSKLLGSGASGSGASYAEITVGSGLTMTGTTLSASGTTPSTYLLMPINFQVSGTYNHSEGGSGSNSYGSTGLVQTTGATGTSKAYLHADVNGSDDIGGKSMRFHARCAITTNGTDYKAFLGIGVTNENATPFAPVNRWIGIKIERASSGSITVKGTCADNSTESTATLSGVTATNWFDLGIDITSSAVNFYIDGTNKGTITTNIPANLYYYYSSGVTNLAVASSTALSVFGASLEILSY